jgi:hypothetical protein
MKVTWRSIAAMGFGTTWLVAAVLAAGGQPRDQTTENGREKTAAPVFETSDNCMACHNGLTSPGGEDVSIGSAWRASMMANSSRDPYWQAAVRRETIDHAARAGEIQDECSTCHMPMARAMAAAAGRPGAVFAHLPIGRDTPEAKLAADGVSCTLCHQISDNRLGSPQSFNGGFALNVSPRGERAIYGPFQVSAGHAAVMQSATDVKPAESPHIQKSELCATCHTLHTTAIDPAGNPAGSLPEQMPFLEWRHSAFAAKRSCQACHMPEVDQPTPVTSVLGEARPGMSRHTFSGGNFFMLRLLNRYRAELGVPAPAAELEANARATIHQLQTMTATASIEDASISGNELRFIVDVRNLTGHKLPTGYPSRRAWLHVTVRDQAQRIVFQSGAIDAAGAVAGNDADLDPGRYEPHYTEIRRSEEVQIYESVMADSQGRPTTGLLSARSFAKDNRLLPAGFDQKTAPPEIAPQGTVASDESFGAEGDRTRYIVDIGSATGPLTVEVNVRYQPIAYRWAQNLAAYDATETRRFVAYYRSMSAESSLVLSHASARIAR